MKGTADETLNQDEEETKRMVELEAEERKLEETLEYQRRLEEEKKLEQTLEYQRRIEGEAKKQRLDLTNQSKAVVKNYQNDPQSSSADSTSPAVLEGISFGDFHFSEIKAGFSPGGQQAAASSNVELAKGQLGVNVTENQMGPLPLSSPPSNNSNHDGPRKANKVGRQTNQKHKKGPLVRNHHTSSYFSEGMKYYVVI